MKYNRYLSLRAAYAVGGIKALFGVAFRKVIH